MKLSSLEKVIWTQEEPQNMGGWNFVLPRLQEILPNNIKLEYNGFHPIILTLEYWVFTVKMQKYYM